ncbi:hypothetical protein MVEN_01151800 [Mycena venus]|uniref:Sodium/calcium exchanger membrane region domain-containing protein n=1 Tax=Mycena venus TaxID=2733690 RepID=A0A8H6Y475_9AGAR|nr:hypothetical protein MVEN_01151800 [Mycena venus]
MVHADVVAYNIAVIIVTLFILEFGADKFIDHTVIVSRRTGIPATIIALLTAGAEWEELAVVVASLAQGRASLSIGNIIGSAISNILGAFSLGLLFHEKGKPIHFDTSSRIYSILLLSLTTFVTPITYFSKRAISLACGITLIALFGIYVGSIGWAISKGNLAAPEDSDDDSSDGNSSVYMTERRSTSRDQPESLPDEPAHAPPSGHTHPTSDPAPGPSSDTSRHRHHTLRYHIFYLFIGFLAICIAGYVLSHAAIIITDEFGISDVLFGVIILAIITTLPEKFIAVISGHRGHVGILVANTAGSNIFLLSLCLGIIMVDTSGKFNDGNVKIPELAVLWGSTLGFTLTVWFGGKFSRWIGAVMLLCYVAFIVLEFTVIHSVN